MNFGFTQEQELLRAEARKWLDQCSPMEEVRKVAETPDGFSRALWKETSELGWAGLTIPEPHGGRWQQLARGWPHGVIDGDTPNIQKNIIAERILGLPHD